MPDTDDISDKELEELYDKIDAEIAMHPASDEDLQAEIDRLNQTVTEK